MCSICLDVRCVSDHRRSLVPRELLSPAASSERIVKWAADLVLSVVDSVAPSPYLRALKS